MKCYFVLHFAMCGSSWETTHRNKLNPTRAVIVTFFLSFPRLKESESQRKIAIACKICIYFHRKVCKCACLTCLFLYAFEVINVESHSKYPKNTFTLYSNNTQPILLQTKQKAIQISVCTLPILSFAMVTSCVFLCHSFGSFLVPCLRLHLRLH